MINDIELAKKIKKQKKIVPGHRTCAGCPIAIIFRTILASTDNPVVVASATSCAEVTTTIYPYTSWNIPWIHSVFANAAATISGVESAYKAQKKKGKIKKDIKFLAFGGDGGSFDIGLQSLSGALERGHDFVYVCYDNEGYMNCLSTDTLIMTETGLKQITKIKKGEKVWAFNQKTYEPILKKCTGVFDNGRKKVYEIETLHQNIKATSNHPFLTIKRNVRGQKIELVWKTVSKLKQNDEIITMKNLDVNKKSYKFKKIKLSEKEKSKINSLNKVKIPEKSSKELMKWLGLYVGDGWIKEKRGEIGFALPEKTQERKEIIKLHKKIFNQEKHSLTKYYVYFNSINISKFINSLGFNNSAKTIPSWIYTLPKEEKEEFIKGLIMSDGYVYKRKKESYRYVSASKDLVERLRLLLQTINYRVGKITVQEKKKETKIVNRELLNDSKYYSICFSKKDEWNIKKYPSQYKYQNYLINNKYFEVRKIKNIIPKKIEPTLDLRIEGEHNFIANGIVVHNTGNQRSSATPYGASTTTTPTAIKSFGKTKFQKDLAKIAIAHDIPYVATANPSNQIDLYEKAKKAFEKKGPAVIVVFAACPTNMKAPPELTIEISKSATESNYWPLYEYEDGKYKINYKPPNRIPITEFLKTQTKFNQVIKNKKEIENIQIYIDKKWEELLNKEKTE
jgi:pyruvate/2-oxoacid:ferredoxin oxidoreductase beta subunit/intein/homing endonuclease